MEETEDGKFITLEMIRKCDWIEKVDIEGVTPEDIENMSDAEFDKFSKAAGEGTTKFKVESKK